MSETSSMVPGPHKWYWRLVLVSGAASASIVSVAVESWPLASSEREKRRRRETVGGCASDNARFPAALVVER